MDAPEDKRPFPDAAKKRQTILMSLMYATMPVFLVILVSFILLSRSQCDRGSDKMDIVTISTKIMGMRCQTVGVYALLLCVCFLLQFTNKLISNISRQVKRDMFKVPFSDRNTYVWKVIVYNILSFFMWMISVLLISSSNLGVLVALFLGQFTGILCITFMQKSDTHSITVHEKRKLLGDMDRVKDGQNRLVSGVEYLNNASIVNDRCISLNGT